MDIKKLPSIALLVLLVLGFAIFYRINSLLTQNILSPDLYVFVSNLGLTGSKEIVRQTKLIHSDQLKNSDVLKLTFNLHGLCLLDGKASEIGFEDDNGNVYPVFLTDYASDCYEGEQIVYIPISDFFNQKPNETMLTFFVQFWNPTPFFIEIYEALAYNSYGKAQVLGASSQNNKRDRPAPHPTKIKISSVIDTPLPTIPPILTLPPNITSTTAPSPTITPTPSPTIISSSTNWSIQSVSSMKETKDRICNQRGRVFIEGWVDKAKELGVNYISIETPYDNPTCGSSLEYTQLWIEIIRSRGLKVWHRHMPLAFEGIYDTPKTTSQNYIEQIANYIKANPQFFSQDDIFTPIPEPQNGGISGVTYCPHNVCQFTGASSFNIWLRNAITNSDLAFQSVGLAGKIKIGYYGFDGFVAWGDNNPDWDGILENETIQLMGNITIDHYPEIVNDTMENDLNELMALYPNVPIIIGEWGTITNENIEQQVINTMNAAKRPNVIGFNYWHMGIGGNEELVHEDLSNNIQFDEVQSFFRPF